MLFKLRPSKVTTNKLQICMIDGRSLENVNAFKYLGLWLDTELSFNAHIEATVLKVKQCLCQLYRLIVCFTFDTRKRIAQQLLLPLIDYADIVYHTSSVTSLNALDLVFNSICRFVLRYPFMTHHCTLYEKLDWLQPKERRRYHWFMFIFSCINYANKCPPYLQQYFVRHISVYPIRHLLHPFFAIPRIHREIGRRAFCHKGPMDWNNLPLSLKSITSLHSFKVALFLYLKIPCSCFN